MDQRTRAMLADASPKNWEEARRRLAVIRRYLRSGERSAEAADAHARDLGVSRSLFYRVARIYAAGENPQDDGAPRDHPVSEVIIARSIDRAGPSASVSQIFRTAIELADEQGLPNPSMSTVRIRSARKLAGRSIATRLGLNAEFALDRASLDMVVDAGAGRLMGAQLACLLNLEQGIVVRHLLCAGAPSEQQVASLLRNAVPAGGRIAVSKSDPLLMVDTVRSTIQQEDAMLVPGRWRAGRALRLTIGLKIGRVQLLSREPEREGAAAIVKLDTARQVIGELMLQFGDARR